MIYGTRRIGQRNPFSRLVAQRFLTEPENGFLCNLSAKLLGLGMGLGLLLALTACQPEEMPRLIVGSNEPMPQTLATQPAVSTQDRTGESVSVTTIQTPSVRASVNQTDSGEPCLASNCHADLKQKEQQYKHQPYTESRCLDCHTDFHSPLTEQKRLQIELDLCYACHTRNALGNSHPVGPGIFDPNTGKTMTCTSTCHRSHTAPYRYLLTLSGKGALCVSCHQEFIK